MYTQNFLVTKPTHPDFRGQSVSSGEWTKSAFILILLEQNTTRIENFVWIISNYSLSYLLPKMSGEPGRDGQNVSVLRHIFKLMYPTQSLIGGDRHLDIVCQVEYKSILLIPNKIPMVSYTVSFSSRKYPRSWIEIPVIFQILIIFLRFFFLLFSSSAWKPYFK